MNNIKYISSNGCMIGPCLNYNNSNCFEITDKYKGDFARTYFYLSIAYMNIFNCCDDIAVNNGNIKSWMENDLKQWHQFDPVDIDEQKKNNLIFLYYQKNRNPFIDFPELVDQIDDF